MNKFFRTLYLLLSIICFYSCNAQSQSDLTNKVIDTNPKIATERNNFIAHLILKESDGTKTEIDTITGYRKYYYSNSKVQMEGKITKAEPKDYRDGIWNYYNEQGLLMRQECSNKDGLVNKLEYMYFSNDKPLSKTYSFFEGDYRDKSNFKFHLIETLFYTNGKELSTRHWINKNLIDEKCWDAKGNPKPIEYLETIKTVEVEE